MNTRLFLGVIIITLFASCSTTHENNLAYFKDLQNIQDATLAQVTSIQSDIYVDTDDELLITVTSSQADATANYNLPLANPAKRGALTVSTQPTQQTYIVAEDGTINFPVLGSLAVKGKTVDEIAAMIKDKVALSVRDPYVNVQLVNFYVNVMGEVKEPQRVQVTKRRFTLMDALASAGDLTEFAERDNIIVARNDNGKITYHRLDLTNSNIASSPYYYMKQNDIVYVTPNKIRVDNSKYNQNNAFKLSVISTIVSATSVIASLVIALAVK